MISLQTKYAVFLDLIIQNSTPGYQKKINKSTRKDIIKKEKEKDGIKDKDKRDRRNITDAN